MTMHRIYKLGILLIVLLLFASTCTTSGKQQSQASGSDSTKIALAYATLKGSTDNTSGSELNVTGTITPTVYMPIAQKPGPKFAGIYMDEEWSSEDIAKLQSVDSQAGKKETSVGWFINFEDAMASGSSGNFADNKFYKQLDALWNAGYISFVNLSTNTTLQNILDGQRDQEITYVAQSYKAWVDQGGGRRAMIAILQEMNGPWSPYGNDPNTSEQYKAVYKYILGKFEALDVTRDKVWWVFAPNGYSDPGNDARRFENYYPGDDVVDVVGFSSFNFGYCPAINSDFWRWESYPQIFEDYITRMRRMAPSKPIIIAETATPPWSSKDQAGKPVFDVNQMNQWLIENYDYFAVRTGVIGVYYYSYAYCDFKIDPGGQLVNGYKSALSNPAYKYFNASDLDNLIHQTW